MNPIHTEKDPLVYALRHCQAALEAATAGDLAQVRIHLRVAIPSLELEAEVTS